MASVRRRPQVGRAPVLAVHSAESSLDLVGIAAVLTALGGIAAVMLQTRSNHAKLRNIEKAVNHADEEVSSDGPITLGQRVKQVQDEGRAASLSNLQAHEAITAALRTHITVSDGKFAHIEDEVAETKAKITEHDAWERDEVRSVAIIAAQVKADAERVATAVAHQAGTVPDDSTTPS